MIHHLVYSEDTLYQKYDFTKIPAHTLSAGNRCWCLVINKTIIMKIKCSISDKRSLAWKQNFRQNIWISINMSKHHLAKLKSGWKFSGVRACTRWKWYGRKRLFCKMREILERLIWNCSNNFLTLKVELSVTCSKIPSSVSTLTCFCVTFPGFRENDPVSQV